MRKLKPSDVAPRYGVHEVHIRDLCRKGVIPCLDISLPGSKYKRYRMSEADLEEYERRRGIDIAEKKTPAKPRRNKPRPAFG